MVELYQFYREMYKIRYFEENIMKLFSENKVSGTTHTYIGQEAVAVAVMNNISNDDIVFSNHRCHGHYIAYGGPVDKLLSEIMSKSEGVCQGKGGSQHIHYKNFYTNGIQGGIVPNAAGMSWAAKMNNKDQVAIVFLGDGTLGQGVVYETLNISSLYDIPVLFIVENNQYAMTTHVNEGIAGNIAGRVKAFDIKHDEIESNDVEELNERFRKAMNYVRGEKKPFCQIIHTYRLGAHSKGDETRDADEIGKHKKNDPIFLLEQKLDKETCLLIKKEIEEDLDIITEQVLRQDYIQISTINKIQIDKKQKKLNDILNKDCVKGVWAINSALDECISKEDDIVVIGEDIKDPYGGAFKVTKGLSSKYPKQILNMPISEAGYTGIAVGLAMNGKKPIVEMMFGDFISLAFDQILNHAVKYEWIFGNNVNVPMIIRLPTGGRRGYGPTHSQSLEKYLMGIPLINIMAISSIFNIYELYKYAIKNANSPTIIIENKKIYSERLLVVEDGRVGDFFIESTWNDQFPSVRMTLDRTGKADVVLITYGGTIEDCMEAAEELMLEEEVQVDIIVLTQISPLPMNDLIYLLRNDRVVGTVEEGTMMNGWGAEIIASLSDAGMINSSIRVATDDVPIPNGVLLEKQIVPDKNKIIGMIKGMMR